MLASAAAHLRDEFQRRGVDAVPLPRRGRAVVEDVAEVDPRARAHNLHAAHPHGEVRLLDDVVRVDRGGEARPAWRARARGGVRSEAAGRGPRVGPTRQRKEGRRPLVSLWCRTGAAVELGLGREEREPACGKGRGAGRRARAFEQQATGWAATSATAPLRTHGGHVDALLLVVPVLPGECLLLLGPARAHRSSEGTATACCSCAVGPVVTHRAPGEADILREVREPLRRVLRRGRGGTRTHARHADSRGACGWASPHVFHPNQRTGKAGRARAR